MANLLATKPLNLLMEEARETGEHSLKRTLGVFQLTALGVGAIIGAGIFVMVGLGAQYAGPGLTLAFVLSGFGCAFAGLCYAEFAAMIPLAGRAYTYGHALLGAAPFWDGDRLQSTGVYNRPGDHRRSGGRNQGERQVQRYHRHDQSWGCPFRDRSGNPLY